MTTRPTVSPLSRVRAAELGRDDGPTDGQLLGRFVEERDEAALGALVRRLGPAVLGVCRRVIGDAHLAEDAFQATFLVLARKADQIRPREQVGAWLYGVAYRVARRARAARCRRLTREQPMSARSTAVIEPPDRSNDLLAVLDQELAKLPEHYRAVILLCDLDGRTRKDAATRLGIPDGTLSNRLAAARKMLARRLSRRGVALGAGGIAVLLSQAPVAARVPPALVGTTARLATGDAGSPAAPAVSALADGEMKMILLTKLNGLVASVAAVVVGAALAVQAPATGNDPPREPAPALVAVTGPLPRAKPAEPPAPKVIDNDGSFDNIAFSPDGKLIAAQTRVVDENDRTKTTSVIKVWDVKTGKLVKTVFEGKNVLGVAFAPDGKHVAATTVKFDPTKNKPGDVRGAFTSEVIIWDAATGTETARLTDCAAHTLYHVAYSPDGKYVATGGGIISPTSVPAGGDVTVWDAKTGKVLWANQDHKDAIRRLSFSADGTMLATPSDDGTVRVWDSFTGKHLKTFDPKAQGGVYSAAFSPDGKLVAGWIDGAVRVWDVATGEEKHTLKGYKPGSMAAVRFLPDGTLLTAGTSENADGNLKLWDVTTGKLVKAFTDPNLTMRSLDVTADGKTAAVGTSEKTLVLVPLGK